MNASFRRFHSAVLPKNFNAQAIVVALQLTAGSCGWGNLMQQYCLKCSGAAGLHAPSLAGVVVSTVFKQSRHGPITPKNSQAPACQRMEGFSLILPYDVNLAIGHTLDIASSHPADGGATGGTGG